MQIGDRIYAITEPLQRDGTLAITHNGHELSHRLVQRLERNAPILNSKELAERPTKRPTGHPPKPDHPWKKHTLLPPAWGDISALRSGDISALR